MAIGHAIAINREPDWKAAENLIDRAATGDREVIARFVEAWKKADGCPDVDEGRAIAAAREALQQAKDAWNEDAAASAVASFKLPQGGEVTAIVTVADDDSDYSEYNLMVMFELSGLAEAAGFAV